MKLSENTNMRETSGFFYIFFIVVVDFLKMCMALLMENRCNRIKDKQ